MDSLLTAAAQALANGDPLAALRRVALRDDPAALALRGTAMAQLGELTRARQLLRRAARAFGPRERVARARCAVAEAEIALAARDLPSATHVIDAARRVLEQHGDLANAAHAQLIAIRHQLLLGRVVQAEARLRERDWATAPPMIAAIAELAAADLSLRHAQARAARRALQRAQRAAERAGIPMLRAEVEQAMRALSAPAARLISEGQEQVLTLDAVEDLLASDRVVIDACRRVVRWGDHLVLLAKRPVLFTLVRVLAEAWPGDAARDDLITRALGARRPNDTHRASLRVELGRLRRELREIAEVRATARGFQLHVGGERAVVLLAPPLEEVDTTLLALLADGTAWSTSALALAHGSSQRTVQRLLSGLEAAGRVRSLGRARAQRWLALPLT
ncbi:MAG: helix-turn-helix domain-containing protein, partial [Polyangiales bacterium]